MRRIYHTWDQWECYPAGFYENVAPGDLSPQEATRRYAEFLRDTDVFAAALQRVLDEWPNSCEHYLSNENMNRIAWLGQASACIALGLPSCFRGGFNQLTTDEQLRANETALVALNQWLAARGEPTLTLDDARARTKVDLY